MSLVDDFRNVVELAAALENTTIPDRVTSRLANAYSRAIEKALVLTWYDVAAMDAERTNRTLFRHAERGAREFVP